MADDLDENFELDEKFSTQQQQQHDQSDNESVKSDEEKSFASVGNGHQKKTTADKGLKRKFEQVFSDATKTSNKKANKKKNITEILKLKKDELERPTYAINEFKKFLIKFINVNLSSVEKNELNLSEVSRFMNSQIRFGSYFLNKHNSRIKVSLTGEEVESVDAKLDKIILKRNKISHLSFDEQFNEKFNGKLEVFLQKPPVKQSPFLIVLCSSAMRCIEVQSKLDTSNELIKSKKLRWMHAFAKHKKLPQQIDQIKKLKTPINVVYATPQRLAQLVEAEALLLDQLKYVVIDYTHRDVKQKRFMDMPEIKEEFLKFCFGCLLKLNKDKCQVKFYLA